MTEPATLSEFLLARIAEDEREIGFVHNDECDRHHPPGFPCDCSVPERTRLRCEADRRIVELHEVVVVSIPAYGTEEGVVFVEPDSFEDITTRRLMCSTCHNLGDEGPCATLRLLALPYADHPDYREEWRP